MEDITNACTVQPSWKPIISLDHDTSIGAGVFDSKKHLSYTPPNHTYKMTDLGYHDDTGCSPIAASDPFQLFTPEAVKRFRSEIFKPEVMENYKYTGDLGAFALRGYANKYAPFVYHAWQDPTVLKIVSDIAGVELVPAMDFEIGHVNISVKTEEQANKERNTYKHAKHAKDSDPVVGWHRDSYPFVCVLMLSDCTNMVGGETALRTADGKIIKIRGPSMGCAVVLQGRYITHQALKALGAQERITMVTSFRPKSPYILEDSVLDTVRGVSDLSELYYGYAEYRLGNIEERLRCQLDILRKARSAGRRTNTKEVKRFIAESIKDLEQTNREIVQDEDVVAGHQPTMDIPDAMVLEVKGQKGIKSML